MHRVCGLHGEGRQCSCMDSGVRQADGRARDRVGGRWQQLLQTAGGLGLQSVYWVLHHSRCSVRGGLWQVECAGCRGRADSAHEGMVESGRETQGHGTRSETYGSDASGLQESWNCKVCVGCRLRGGGHRREMESSRRAGGQAQGGVRLMAAAASGCRKGGDCVGHQGGRGVNGALSKVEPGRCMGRRSRG